MLVFVSLPLHGVAAGSSDVKVSSIYSSQSFVNIGSTVNLYVSLVYDADNTPVTDGTVTLEGLTSSGYAYGSISIAVGTMPYDIALDSATGKAYVVNSDDDTVSVINTATNVVTATITVGDYPLSVIVDSAAGRAYVTNFSSNTVSVINTVTDTVISTISVGTGPVALALDAGNNRLYVVNRRGNSVSVVSTITAVVTNTVGVGNFPYDITLDTVNGNVYVPNYSSNDLSIIDTTTLTVTNVAVGSHPQSAAVDTVTGKVYVANNGGNTVSVIDVVTNTVTATVTVGNSPYRLAVDQVKGKAYVLNGGNTVSVIDTTTDAIATTITVGVSPIDLFVDTSNGKVYVANWNGASMSVINTSTYGVSSVAVGSSPRTLVVNTASEKVYVVCQNSKSVSVLTKVWVFTDSKLTAQAVTYDSMTISGNSRGATTVDMNGKSVTVTWDQVKVQSITGSTDTAFLGASVNVDVALVYASDSTPVTDGAVTINGASATHQGAGVWRISVSKSTAQTVTYNTVTATGNTRGITSVDMNGQSDSVTWRAPYAIASSLTSSKSYLNVGDTIQLYAGLIYEDTGDQIADGTVTLEGLAMTAGTAVNAVALGTNPIAQDIDQSRGKIYVANYGSGTVSVINTATNTVATTITVGSWPRDVAVDSAGDRVYVVNYNSHTISVISASTDTVVATITVGSYPIALALDSTHSRLYVANSQGNSVSVIDVTTNTVVATIPVGTNPRNVLVDSTNHKVYVSNYNGVSVSVIDTTTNTVTMTLAVGVQPTYMVLDSTVGKVYVVNTMGSSVSVISTASNTVTATIPVGWNPNYIVLDSGKGKAYVANSNSNTVSVINTTTDAVTSTIPVVSVPFCMAIDTTRSRLYVVRNNAAQASVVDTTSDTVTTTLTLASISGETLVDPTTGKAYFLGFSGNCVSISSTQWTASDTKSSVQTVTYDSMTISGNSRNADVVDMNGHSINVVWDQVQVTGITRSANDVCIGTSVNVDASLVYASDGTLVTDGAVTINGVSATHIGGGVWRVSVSKSTPQTVTYDTVTATGNTRGITSINMNGQSTSVTWRLPHAIVSSLTSSKSYMDLNGVITLYVELVYEDTGLSVTDGTMTLNGLPVGVGYKSKDVSAGTFPAAVVVDTSNGKIYAANKLGASISVIDASSETVTNTISVGSQPSSMALYSSLNKLYVANSEAKTISVINTLTGTVSTTISLSYSPQYIAVNPTTGKVYVSHLNDKKVSIINSATDTVSTVVSLGSFAYGIAVDSTRGKVFVAYVNSNGLAVLDATTDALIDTITVCNGPIDFALDSTNGLLYVAGRNGSSISVVNTATDVVVATIAVGANPYAVALDADDGKVYVANNGGNTVSVIDTASNTVTATIAVGSGPADIAYDSTNGVVFVLNQSGETLSVIDCSTDAVISTITLGDYPQVVVAGGNGKAYVANGNGHSVVIISSTWQITDTKSSVSSVTYNSMTLSGNSRGATVVDMNGQSISVTWDQVRVQSVVASDDTVIVGTSVNVDATLVYASDGTPVTDGTVTIGGVSATHQGADVWRISTSKSTAQPVTYDTVTTAGNTRGITSVDMNGQSDSVTWRAPYAVVNNLFSSKSYLNIGSTVTLYIDLVYEDTGNPVTDGTVTLNGATVTLGPTTSTIGVGGGPYAVAVDPATSKAYVINNGDSTVTVIDTTNDAVLATINVGLNPYDLAIDSTRGRVYVTNVNGGSVSVIDTTSDTVIATIGVGLSPRGLAIDTVTGKVYVANYASSTVYVIDPTSNTVTAIILVGTSPFSVAVNSAAGKVYVTNYGGSTVSVINIATNAVIRTIGVGANPRVFAINSATGKGYVTNQNSDTVSVIDMSDDSVTSVPVGDAPYALAVDSAAGKIYVANRNSNTVSVIDASSNAVTATIAVGTYPYDITADSARGKVYVANELSDSVSIISTSTNTVVSTMSVGSHPYSVAVDPNNGKVYAANNFAGTATMISTPSYATDSKSTVQTVTYNSMTISGNSRGSTVVNMGGHSVTVVWDQVKVMSITGSADNVNVGTSVDIDATLVYASDNTPVTDGAVTINGASATHQGGGIWRVSTSKGTPQTATYDTVTATGNARGITSVDMNGKSDAVTWDQIQIQSITGSADYANIGSSVNVDATLVYASDGTPVTDGTVTINGTPATPQGAGVWSISVSKSTVQTATYNTVTATGNARGITSLDMNGKSDTVTWDQIQVQSIVASADFVSSGANADIDVTLVYVSDSTPVTDGTVTINGVSATHQGAGVWRATDSKSIVQTVTYDTITASGNARGITLVDVNGNSDAVIWDQVKVQSVTSSQGSVLEGTNVDIEVTLVYASDNTPVIDGTVAIEGNAATHRGAGVWRSTVSSSSAQSIIYDTVTATGNLRGITSVNMNGKSTTVQWESPPPPPPPVNNTTPANNTYTVDQMITSHTYLNIGEQATIRVHVSDSNGDAAGCTVYIGALYETTGGDGWATFTVTNSTPSTKTFTATHLTGIDGEYIISAGSVTVTWDRIDIEASIVDDYLNVGQAPEITYRAVYAVDGTEFTGTITWDTPTELGENTATITAVVDALRGLTKYTYNNVTYVNDRIEVTASGSSKVSASVSEPITIWFKAHRAYSGEAFDASSGSLNAEGLDLQWSDANGRWEASVTYDVSTVKTFRVASATDTEHGVTALSRGDGVTVEWTDGSTIPTVETLNGTEMTNTTTTKETPQLTLSLSADEETMSVTASGSLSANNSALDGWSLLVEYRPTGSFIWNTLTSVTTGSGGGYSYTWNIAEEGAYEVRVTSASSEAYAEASKHASISVEPTEVDYLLVTSNSTLSLVDVAGLEFSFTVTGESGTWGHAEIKVYKSMAASIDLVKVFIDNVEISYNYIEYDDYWLIVVDYTHSQHIVDVVVEEPVVDYTPYYALGALLAAFILFLILWRRKKEDEKSGVVKK